MDSNFSSDIETYKIWAPDNALWTEWVKPVLFAGKSCSESYELNMENIDWMQFLKKDTALIVDLPGDTGVKESLTLAQLGYRPVPLYNGVHANSYVNKMAVDVRELTKALFATANLLKSFNLKNDAPPVFMLDSMRFRSPFKTPTSYDNRWCIFPQDMPSASFLIKHGIRKVTVRTDQKKIQDDLAHILFRYQEAGIKIQQSWENNDIKDINVSKPPQFKNLFYRLKVIMGLTRNAAGGFGGIIPFEDHSSSGGRYFGIG
ncbi:MAG: hypothetical protein FWG99_03255 [Treponema sp.]|nr:hypothetical protein [Treponema sp.]